VLVSLMMFVVVSVVGASHTHTRAKHVHVFFRGGITIGCLQASRQCLRRTRARKGGCEKGEEPSKDCVTWKKKKRRKRNCAMHDDAATVKLINTTLPSFDVLVWTVAADSSNLWKTTLFLYPVALCVRKQEVRFRIPSVTACCQQKREPKWRCLCRSMSTNLMCSLSAS
jgi:hypothetical protein